jgi:non-specific protein-tyrosine kinase
MFAREFAKTVLLVDADLRMQSIHRYLGYQSRVGLIDYLEEKVPMNDIIVWPGIEKFTVISGNRVVEESSELMGSPRMQGLVAELKSRYDDRYVIFDVPPVLGGADALAFAPLVDCIILVVGAGVTRQQDLKSALELLPQEKVAGFVLNRFNGTTHLYGRYSERL